MEIFKQIVNAQFAASKAAVEYQINFMKGFIDEYEKQVRELNKRT